MTGEELEFSIAQYADGTLPAGERAALEAVLARDAGARALLAEYRALDAALADAAHADALPGVRWDALAERTSRIVAERADAVVPEDDERLIAQLADQTIDDSERPAIEAKVAADPALRVMLDDYQSLDQILKNASPVPSLQWDRVASMISGAVAAQASDAVSEQAEFAIAQYADGTLAGDDAAEVAAKLQTSAAAQSTFAQYQRVDALLKSAPLPEIQWDRLAAHLSEAVANADAAASRSARSYRIADWIRSPMRLAAAASVLLAVGIGAWIVRSPKPTPVAPAPRVATLSVQGPVPEVAAGPSVADVTIGPPPAVAEGDDGTDGYASDLVSRPSRAIVAGTAVAIEDRGALSPF